MPDPRTASDPVTLLRNRLAHNPRLRERVGAWRDAAHGLHHDLARVAPAVMRAVPYKLMIAITAHCNARCVGCHYGTGNFMPGERLPLDVVRHALDDAAALGYRSIRFYGGEPLLHPDLPAMVAHAKGLGLRPYVTTNGISLAGKIDGLVEAGLRDLSLGLYGTGAAYDAYVRRPNSYARLVRGLEAVRERHGEAIDLQLNWLLMRPTANRKSLDAAFDLAARFDAGLRVDLIHYSLPYFTEGPERCLQFRPEDRPDIETVVLELLRRKKAEPQRIRHSVESLRSIPDWLLKGPGMKVPCTAYDMVWVGADGTVQLCYVTFRLGNLHETRLGDLLMTHAHHKAARDAFKLNCPNCHCSSNERIMRHRPSRAAYAAPLPGEAGGAAPRGIPTVEAAE